MSGNVAKICSNCLKSKLFWVGLSVKIIFGATLGSQVISDLFLPFILFFKSNLSANPYDVFINAGINNAFPYPSFMLYLMTLPFTLFGGLSSSPFWQLFLCRIPLLAADFSILLLLIRLTKKPPEDVIKLYWLSPVLLYISYIHGQLDAIPIALLLISAYALFKEKFQTAFVVLGLAISTKSHILLIAPLFIIFSYKRLKNWKMLIGNITLSIMTFIIINAAHISSPAFFKMVFQNHEQIKLFDLAIPFGTQNQFYLIPAAMAALLARALTIKMYNKNLFLTLTGLIYGILLLFVTPQPGWYFWILPIFAYIYLENSFKNYTLFFLLQGSFLLYLLTHHNNDFFSIFQFISPAFSIQDNLFTRLQPFGLSLYVENISLTVLQTILALNCIWIYKKGFIKASSQNLTSKPFLLGIGGNSGVGKSTLAKSLEHVFGSDKVTTIAGDDLHKWERGNQNWQKITHLNPKANNLHAEISFLNQLKNGCSIQRRHYDHKTGKFTKFLSIKPNPLIIFEGLHTFFLEEIKHKYDLRLFIKQDADLYVHHKIIRDMKKRGYTKADVLKNIKNREKDSEQFIETQKNNADILLHIGTSTPIKNPGNETEQLHMMFTLTLPNTFDIDPLIALLSKSTDIDISHDFNKASEQVLMLKGEFNKLDISSLAKKTLPELQDWGFLNPVWQKGSIGIVQLLVTYIVLKKAELLSN